jgi:UDP-glucuronate 4-epimerase
VEAFAHAFHVNRGLSVSICRLQPLYGPRCRPDMLPRRLLEKIHAGLKIEKYGSGESVRDWLYITDGVAGILAALRTPMGFLIVNLGTGVGTTVNELISIAEAVVGRPAIVETVDVPSGDAHFGGLADITKAKRLLHWEPQVDLKTGLTRTFEYMLREHAEGIKLQGKLQNGRGEPSRRSINCGF